MPDAPEPEPEEAAAARRAEFGWEVLFVAAGVWRAEGYEAEVNPSETAVAAAAAGLEVTHPPLYVYRSSTNQVHTVWSLDQHTISRFRCIASRAER